MAWRGLDAAQRTAALRLHGMGSFASEGKRANALAAKLRKRLVHTVYNSWKSTGFIWEQCDDKTGAGQRSRAFTGWTACVILLMGLEDAAPSMADSDAPGVFSNWSIPTLSIFVLIVGLVLFRRRVTEACRRFVGRCRSWYLDRTRQVEGYEVIDPDDLHESDREDRSISAIQFLCSIRFDIKLTIFILHYSLAGRIQNRHT